MAAITPIGRRKLVQWLLAYLAGAWVLLQVLTMLIGAYHWPDRVLRIAIGGAVVGFLVTLVLAWFHGERGAQRATRAELGLLSALLVAGGLGVWLGERGRDTAPAPVAKVASPAAAAPVKKAAAKTIAVLPFVNMSKDADNEYFSDGLSEEILNSLARIDGMQVVGRTSSFQFKGRNEDLRGIGEKLGVANVLEGSVRREGNRARITAQLIRAADGIHLWSETYDRTLQDTLAVQLDIAEKVAGALDVLMDDHQRATMRKAGVKNVNAFIAYQKGLKLYDDAHAKPGIGLLDGLRLANIEFDKASALEPEFFQAHFAKADLYEHALQADDGSQAERLQAQRGALKTLELAAAASKDEQQRLLTLAERQMLSDDWRGLPALIDAAFKAPGCNPSNWLPVFASAFGYGDALEDQGARASACDPLNRINYSTRITVALATGHAQRALDIMAAIEKTSRLQAGPQNARAIALAMLGRIDAAGKELDAIDPAARPDSNYVARVIVGRAQGLSPADIHVRAQDIKRKQGKYDQWLLADAVEAANAGNRVESNRLAAAMDARPAGPFLLAVLSVNCYCDAPFDLAATPNFKARLAQSGLRWPPPRTIAFPPRDGNAKP